MDKVLQHVGRVQAKAVFVVTIVVDKVMRNALHVGEEVKQNVHGAGEKERKNAHFVLEMELIFGVIIVINAMALDIKTVSIVRELVVKIVFNVVAQGECYVTNVVAAVLQIATIVMVMDM